MYQSLYRKWRPLRFDGVAGQPHITDTLKNQAASGRLGHAYLFTGTRGTGKTSCARILARAATCRSLNDGEPCNTCDSCLSQLDGSATDVLEIDAASNSTVDHMRSLRDEVMFAPVTLSKRVYIIDEVHMLSSQAFNALLKTLEEPPEHVLFILATTETHKVPATILSRCQRFAFHRLTASDISAKLGEVSSAEGIALTSEAAAFLARLADGSMRDALSLLDQCLVSGEDSLSLEKVSDSLGYAGPQAVAEWAEAIGRRDTAAALEMLSRLYGQGREVSALLDELCVYFRDALTASIGTKTGNELFPVARLIYSVELLVEAAVQIARGINRRVTAELCVIKLCDERLDPSALQARLERLESAQTVTPITKPAEKPEKPAVKPSPKQPKTEQPVTDETTFLAKLIEASRQKLPVRSAHFFDAGTVSYSLRGDELTLLFDTELICSALSTPENRKIIAETAEQLLKRPVTLIMERKPNERLERFLDMAGKL